MSSICTCSTLLVFFSVQTLSLAARVCLYTQRIDGTCCIPIVCEKDMQYRLCAAKWPAVGNDFCVRCPEGKINPDTIDTNNFSNSEFDVCKVPDCECPPEAVLVNSTSCQRTGKKDCECDVQRGYWGMNPHLCNKINAKKWKIIQRPGYELTLSGDVEPCKRGMFKSKGDNSSCKPHTGCKVDERVEFKGNTTSDTVCVKKPTPGTEESTTENSPTIESTSPTPPSGVNNMTTETNYVVKIVVPCVLGLLTLTVLIILFCVYLKWKKYIATPGQSIHYCTYLMACLRHRSFNHTDRYRRVNGIPQSNGIQVDDLRGNDSLGDQTGETTLMLQNGNPSNHQRSNGQAPRGNPQRNGSANGHIRGSDVGTPDTQRNENGHMSPMDLPHSGSDSRMVLPQSGNQRQQSCGNETQTKSVQSEEPGACYRGALNSDGNEDLKEETAPKHLDSDIIPSENPAPGVRRNSVQGSDDSQYDPAHLGESKHYNGGPSKSHKTCTDSASNPTQASIDKLDVKSISSGEDDNTAIKKPGKARRPVARVRPMEQKKSQQTREDSHITQPTENREETCARPVPYIDGRFVEPFDLNAQSQAASEPSVTTAPEPSSGDQGTNSDDQESGPSSGDHGNNSDHQAPELPSGDLANNSDHQSLENISFNGSDLASLHELSDEDEQQY